MSPAGERPLPGAAVLAPTSPDQSSVAERFSADAARLHFDWPVERPYIMNHFGWRGRRLHEGVDFRAPRGTPLYAAAAGHVLHAGWGLRGFGKTVVIDHGDGWSTVYAHMSKVTVREGQDVERRERIGLSGATGRAQGAHLHFEIRRHADPVDPVLFLPF